jgi:uncharacterized membrane protein YphA (DoxX/SURF4 family)
VNLTLWTLQILLGSFMALASGLPKLILPADALPMPIPIPAPLLAFVGVAEVLGGIGLIVPAVARIKTGLVPLAAAGLSLVAVGGTAYQIAAGEIGNAVFAVAICLLCAFVGYGRWQLAPHRARTGQPTLVLVR